MPFFCYYVLCGNAACKALKKTSSKEGRYKWKGIYKDDPISFDMQDSSFKDAVFFENIPFQHGTVIKCVLFIHREIDEIGDVKITGYSVTTVMRK